MNELTTRQLLSYVFMLIFDLTVLAGCCYLVFWRNQTGWLFLLVLLLIDGSWTSLKKMLGLKKDE